MHRVLPPVKSTRVVVLGASGFLARDLVRALQAQKVSLVLVGSVEVDLTRPESVAQLTRTLRADDALVMLSALTPDKGRDVATFTKNILMGTHVCAALERQACRHVLYVSSDAVYADSDHQISEETPVSPRGLYALMHAAREQMFQEQLSKLGVPLCMVRPCAVYGPGDTHNSYGPNRFIRSARSTGKIALFGGGEEQREHIYVRDVSEFLMQCLVHRAEGIFNITSGAPISFLDLAKLIVRLWPNPVQIEHMPRTVPISHRRFDVSLRKKLFPETAITPLEQGLAWTLEAELGPGAERA